MKQSKLLKKMYIACIEHDTEKQKELQQKEFVKIFKRKEAGKHFTAKWTILR